jgi:predicted heme/steroid binding protein
MQRRANILLATAAVCLPLLLLVAGCGASGTGTSTRSTPASSPSSPGRTFTVAELAKFNGQNGQPAYVAVDGVVYDVSNSSFWTGGVHNVCPQNSMAGKDLSEAIKMAPPRMRSNLERFPVVGRLDH